MEIFKFLNSIKKCFYNFIQLLRLYKGYYFIKVIIKNLISNLLINQKSSSFELLFELLIF